MSDEDRREENWHQGTDELTADDIKRLARTFGVIAISLIIFFGLAIYGAIKWLM